MNVGIVVAIIGLLLAIFAHPKVMSFVMSRLFNEGLVTPRKISPDQAEVVRFAGPNLSLLFLGILFMIFGIILEKS